MDPRTLPRLTLRVSATLTVILSFFACVGGDAAKDAVKDVKIPIEDAIKSLESESSNWRGTLAQLEKDLSADAQSTIRHEVHNTLLRAEAAAGTEVKCIVDFIGDRVLDDLKAIQSSLNGKPFVRRPRLCQVVPGAIDMSIEPNRRNLVTFDGYNFDDPAMKVVLNERQSGGTNRVDVSQHLTRQTHYHMTLNLGETGVRLSPNSESIVLRFDADSSTISVLHPTLPKCETTTRNVSVGQRTYMPPWDPTTGDREFFGKVDILVRASVVMENGRLLGRLYMKAEQYDDDHTRAEGTDEFDTGFSVPQGWRFESIASTVTDAHSYRDNDWEDDTFERGGGLVRRYVIVGETSTAEAGIKTQVTAYFNPVQLNLVQTTGCAP